ncbi:MAG: TolC family protein [Cyclobacteriaceae bacterium]|nr:TolC family protein [Cyclobacteriaceae bacterium]
MKSFVLLLAFSAIASVHAQELTLQQCYELARQNYPMVRQKGLIAKSKEFTIANAQSGFLPQVSVNAQATYQSEVTRVPIEAPGFSIQPLSKDQYKIYADINQTIYDGGTAKKQNAITESNAQAEDQKLEVELYKIKERIHQLFFGVLLIDEQRTQVDLVRKDLQASLERMESAIRNGVAFRTNADILEAELLKTEQRMIELRANRQAFLDMLGLFINQSLSEQARLQRPVEVTIDVNAPVVRPELNVFSYQSQILAAQHQLLTSRVSPRVGFFLQGGYGRPGLNVLKNEFETYYIGGLRFSWNLGGFYNTNRDKQLLDVNVQSVGLQRETFLFNTRLATRQQDHEMSKLTDLLAVDQKLIDLRTRIKNTAKAQLDNGVITANDYLRELNAEDQARQNQSLHRIQLLMTQYTYQITTGNEK